MQKIIKIIGILIAIAAVVALVVVYITIISPNKAIVKNRESFEISEKGELENGDYIHFLRTDSSDCILLQSGDKFALVDCGEDSDNPRRFDELVYKGYENEILDYLKKNATASDGKVHLDFVLGTHSHSDHIGGFDTIIGDDNVVVNRAYLKVYDETKINDHEVEAWDNKEVYEQMVNALNEKNVPIISDITETKFTLGNYNIKLFNTEYDTEHDKVGENDNAIGMLVEKAGVKVFLAADMDNFTGDEDKYGPQIGKVDILKVGHHSYSGSTSKKWVKTLNPEVCVITNEYEKTDKRTLRRIVRNAKSTILTTGAENGVIVKIDNDGKTTYYNNIH